MKILLVVLALLISGQVRLNADELKIKHVAIEDQVAMKLAADRLIQAQKEFSALKSKMVEKYIYPPSKETALWSQAIGLVRISTGGAESPEYEWRLVEDYSAFIYLQKSQGPKQTCIIGVTTQ